MSSTLLWEDPTRRVAAYQNSGSPTYTVVVNGRTVGPTKGYARRLRAIEAARRHAKALPPDRAEGHGHPGPCDTSCFGHFDS